MSASRVATSPMTGRLPRSRSPPQPKTQSTLPAASAPRLGEHVLERERRVRVVDQDGEGLPLVDGLEAARHALDVRDPGRDRLVLDAEEPGERDRREHVLDVEAPAQARLERDAVDAEPRARGVDLELLGPQVGARR